MYPYCNMHAELPAKPICLDPRFASPKPQALKGTEHNPSYIGLTAFFEGSVQGLYTPSDYVWRVIL